jgi:uncharacterized protein (TIGR03083 family)
MDVSGQLDALRGDGEAFAAAADAGDLGAAVPACPGWTVADLVHHLGSVHEFWATIVAERRQERPRDVRPARRPDGELVGWYRDGLARLVEVLAGTDPATPVWTWSSQRDVAFAVRRMAHETAVHRWDAEDSRQAATPVEANLASDGIDEMLALFLPFTSAGAASVDGTVHIHCGDVPGEWMVRPDPAGGLAVTREHAKGDCALRGPASDLLLVLWRRLPLEAVEVLGDLALAERFVYRPDLS